jgi:polyphosphate kinase 2 (PPK2 family)
VPSRLSKLDLSATLSAEEEAERLPSLQQRLLELRLQLGGLRGNGQLGPALCVLFEGWDASGKGGAIKRLVAPLDPRHVRTVQFAAPHSDERRHHFLYRFIPAMPGLGGMVVFDRTWYGRVLVERVEGYATKQEVRRAYREIRDFEQSFVEEGGVLVKLWLEITADEQLRRFRQRSEDPVKQWKLTDDDWRNRDKRPKYERAVEDMLTETDVPHAPWTLVAAESKRHARVFVLERVLGAIEDGMRAHGIRPLPPLRP